MRAIVLDDDGLQLETARTDPVAAPGEVMVQVLGAGVCATDLEIVRGYRGFRGVLGHEFVGVALTGAFAHQRVVGEINCSCEVCETCRAGRPGHCPHRTVIGILGHDGAFADLIAVPERNLHAVPDAIDTEAAIFTEPLAAAFQITEQLTLTRDDRVAILGDGRLGNLCAQVLAGVTDRVIVVGRHPAKLQLLNSLGIETRVLPESGDVADALGQRADVVVDCTGSANGLAAALKIVRPRGTVVLKTTVAGPQTLSLAPVVVDEVTVVGSRCGPFGRALEALAAGLVDVHPLMSDRFSLSDGVRAIARAAEPGVLKVLIEPALRPPA